MSKRLVFEIDIDDSSDNMYGSWCARYFNTDIDKAPIVYTYAATAEAAFSDLITCIKGRLIG